MDVPHRAGRKGQKQSVHIYLFWDARLQHQYAQLVLPSCKNSPTKIKDKPASLLGTWFNFESKRYQSPQQLQPQWPFNTTVIERFKGQLITDMGTLEPKDLGKDSAALFKEDLGPLNNAGPNQSDTTVSVAAYPMPELPEYQSTCYKLGKVPAAVRELLRLWGECRTITKNEAIKIVNTKFCHSDLGPKTMHAIWKQLADDESNFVK